MFVLNCKIMRDELLRHIPKPDKKSRKRRRWSKGKSANGAEGTNGGTSQGLDAASEVYNPVRCNECNTEVAVHDKEEVFHFFNILASAP